MRTGSAKAETSPSISMMLAVGFIGLTFITTFACGIGFLLWIGLFTSRRCVLLSFLLIGRIWRFQMHDQFNDVGVILFSDMHLVYQVADKKKPPAVWRLQSSQLRLQVGLRAFTCNRHALPTFVADTYH